MKHFLLCYLKTQVLVHWAGNWTQEGLQLPIVVPKQLSYMYAAGNEHDCSCLHP